MCAGDWATSTPVSIIGEICRAAESINFSQPAPWIAYTPWQMKDGGRERALGTKMIGLHLREYLNEYDTD